MIVIKTPIVAYRIFIYGQKSYKHVSIFIKEKESHFHVKLKNKQAF